MDLEKYYKKYNFPASSTFVKQLKNEGIKTTKQEIDKFISNRVEQQKTIIKNERKKTLGRIVAYRPLSLMMITSSAMCIINSISEDANAVKIPNIVVNAVSVLIMSLSNSIKASEKFENFKKLSQQYMMLSQEIEGIEDDVTKEKADILVLKYDNLIMDTSFEDIPEKIKLLVASKYSEAERHVPIQINGVTGFMMKKNNNVV